MKLGESTHLENEIKGNIATIEREAKNSTSYMINCRVAIILISWFLETVNSDFINTIIYSKSQKSSNVLNNLSLVRFFLSPSLYPPNVLFNFLNSLFLATLISLVFVIQRIHGYCLSLVYLPWLCLSLWSTQKLKHSFSENL